MAEKFTNIPVNKLRRNIGKTSTLKLINFLNISPSPVSPRSTKKQLSKFKFHGKNRNRT